MNQKVRNFITPIVFASFFYGNVILSSASLSDMMDLLQVAQANAGSILPSGTKSTTVTQQTAPGNVSLKFPTSAISFNLPKGQSIEELYFSPVFTDSSGNEWTASLPFHETGDAFNSVNIAAKLGHTLLFSFDMTPTASATNNSLINSSPTGVITAYDQTSQAQIASFAFNKISLTSNQQTRSLKNSDDYTSLTMTFQSSANNTNSVTQNLPKNQLITIAQSAPVTASTIASNNISLTYNVITSLTVVSLANNSSNPSSYFTHNWDAIQTAIQNNETITFTIDETTNTISSSVGTTNTLVAAGAPYLIIATDGKNQTSVALAADSFSLSVNAGASSVKDSTIILPSTPINQFQFTIYTTQATNQTATADYLVIPTYLNRQDFVPVLNIFKNITNTQPLSVFMTETTSSATLGFKFGTNILPEHIGVTANNQAGDDYIAIVKDQTGQFHAGVFSASQPLTVELLQS